jgi:hypothetical protein
MHEKSAFLIRILLTISHFALLDKAKLYQAPEKNEMWRCLIQCGYFCA